MIHGMSENHSRVSQTTNRLVFHPKARRRERPYVLAWVRAHPHDNYTRVAQQFGVQPATVRFWVREDAPDIWLRRQEQREARRQQKPSPRFPKVCTANTGKNLEEKGKDARCPHCSRRLDNRDFLTDGNGVLYEVCSCQ